MSEHCVPDSSYTNPEMGKLRHAELKRDQSRVHAASKQQGWGSNSAAKPRMLSMALLIKQGLLEALVGQGF
jgi:hypothetical protein